MQEDETTEEIFEAVCDELEDEIERSDAYRNVAISLIDQLASIAVVNKREERMKGQEKQGPENLIIIAPPSDKIH